MRTRQPGRTWMVRAALAGGILLQPLGNIVFGQGATIVDLKGFQPHETRSAVFTLTGPQTLRIDAIGAEGESARGALSWMSAMWSGTKANEYHDPWTGNAWVLDLRSRQVVWELSAATTRHGAHGTREFDGTVSLPAGTYEAFYSAFPNVDFNDRNSRPGAAQRFVSWLTDEGFDDFALSVHGNAHVLAAVDADRARRDYQRDAVLALQGDKAERFLQAGFVLDRPTEVDLYAEGEIRQDGEFDSAWIINADTRDKIWKLTWRDSAPAGGADKNRFAHLTRTLPAGRYAAFYATDDSHDPSQWNAPPPHDPQAWGLLVRVPDAAARAAVKTFAYENVPANATVVALTRVRNNESRARGFTLNHPMDLRIYALGEASGKTRMADYGWIVSAATHRRVWEMRYDDTEPAGGDAKNRLYDRTVHLDKGDYVVHYVSDDSHAWDDWNAAAPADGEHWGITLLSPKGPLDYSAVAEYAERPDPTIVAQLVGVRNDQRPSRHFTLARESQIRVFALGESTGGSMADYGRIDDAKTGRSVWEMTYGATEHAGGASKNRRFDGTITLPAGDYVLRYQTDDSHAFGSWNAAPPDEPEMWGITVYRVK